MAGKKKVAAPAPPPVEQEPTEHAAKCPECGSAEEAVRNMRYGVGCGGGRPCRNPWHEE
jgi:hypothetical protein